MIKSLVSSHVLQIAQLDEQLRRHFIEWHDPMLTEKYPDADRQHDATVQVIGLCLAGLHALGEQELARTWAEAFKLVEDEEGYQIFVARPALRLQDQLREEATALGDTD